MSPRALSDGPLEEDPAPAAGSAAPSRPTEKIILSFQKGIDREENFRLLFRRYYRLVNRFIAQRGFASDECENLVQETFIAVFAGLPEFRREAGFDGWIISIARNLCNKAVRHRRAGKRSGLEVPLDGSSTAAVTLWAPANPFDKTFASQLRDRLSQALDELPPQMRDCASLRFLHEMTYREIAKALGISVDSVRVQLNRARKKLRLRLGDGFQSTLV